MDIAYKLLNNTMKEKKKKEKNTHLVQNFYIYWL